MPEPTATPESDTMELLRNLIARGAGNTPDAIMLRLLWLRQDHPEAKVATAALHIANDRVVMHASIELPDGGAGSGIAAATIPGDGDWAAQVEGAETIAISRALDTLGYVLREASDQRSPQRAQPPTPHVAPEPDPQRELEPGPEPERDTTPPPRPQNTQVEETAPPVVNALRRARRPQTPEPPKTEAPAEQDTDHLEEYSWSSFWSRARELGLNPNRVTELLGKPANTMTPREAIDGLISADAWPNDNED